MAVKKRLRAGHSRDKLRLRSNIKIDFGECLPITFPIGVDQGLTNVAILSSAWLRPKAVQGEVSGIKVIQGLVRAFSLTCVPLTEARFPAER